VLEPVSEKRRNQMATKKTKKATKGLKTHKKLKTGKKLVPTQPLGIKVSGDGKQTFTFGDPSDA
jgi:hypothetical protein